MGDPLLPQLGNGGYDVEHYDVELSIEPASNHLDGSVRIDALALQRLTSFNLDFGGPLVREILVDERAAGHCRQGGELIVVPDSPVEDSFSVSISYAGSPTGILRSGAPSQEGWNQISDETVTVGGLWGAEAAYMPVNATNLDKATVRLAVTVPAPLAVAGIGTLVDVGERDDSSLYEWVSDVPTPPSRIFLATGRFELDSRVGPNGIQIQDLLPPNTPPELEDDLSRAPAVLRALTDRLGPFPFPTIGFTSIPDSPWSGAIGAHGRVVVMGRERIGDAVLAHELGHQWFGNSITPATTQDDWLSEGFATYTESLWVESNLGPGHADDLPRHWWAILGDSTRPLGVVDDAGQLGDSTAYFRGAATLHALRHEIGDDSFFRVLQRYAADFRHSSASTDDFIQAAEEVSGRDLGGFFGRWLYQSEVPPIPTGR